MNLGICLKDCRILFLFVCNKIKNLSNRMQVIKSSVCLILLIKCILYCSYFHTVFVCFVFRNIKRNLGFQNPVSFMSRFKANRFGAFYVNSRFSSHKSQRDAHVNGPSRAVDLCLLREINTHEHQKVCICYYIYRCATAHLVFTYRSVSISGLLSPDLYINLAIFQVTFE